MNFSTLGLIEPLVRAVEELGYRELTPIQAKSIPLVLSGRDVLASAQTGTGKTASFVLPMLHRLSQSPSAKARFIKALILTPTRELTMQVHENIIGYSRYLSMRTLAVFGGTKINPQIRQLAMGVDVLVATPGRLMDLYQQGAVKFDAVQILVLDEADRMLDMGFIHDINRITRLMPSLRQNLMFSATFSNEIRQLAKGILVSPQEVDVAPRNTSAESVTQYIHPVDKGRKHTLLSHLIHQNKWEQALVFSRTKHGANKLVKQLAAAHIHSAAIHGNKSQSQRTKTLSEFKTGKLHVLVATDIAARGLDIEKLPCVINYDLPQVAEDYVHRIGRTARAGESGLAVSLVSADEIAQLQSIEKLIKKQLQRIEVDDFEPEHALPTRAIASAPKNHPPKNRPSFGEKQRAKGKYRPRRPC